MPAPWTDEGRRSLESARERARDLGHADVTTGHLILGMLAIPGCTAATALESLGVTLESARGGLAAMVTACGSPRHREAVLPLSAVLRELVKDQAAFEAAALDHREIGTMHLLLALTTAGDDSTAMRLLGQHGLTPRTVRDQVLTGPRSETGGTAVKA